MTKNILITIIALIVIVGGGIYLRNNPKNSESVNVQEHPVPVTTDTFSGKLEKVDTGCFADGECYVVVDGKHVTAIMGWSKETVGTIQGVASFGDLADHIGEEVEVHALKKADGTYTLYGDANFYIKLK